MKDVLWLFCLYNDLFKFSDKWNYLYKIIMELKKFFNCKRKLKLIVYDFLVNFYMV